MSGSALMAQSLLGILPLLFLSAPPPARVHAWALCFKIKNLYIQIKKKNQLMVKHSVPHAHAIDFDFYKSQNTRAKLQ